MSYAAQVYVFYALLNVVLIEAMAMLHIGYVTLRDKLSMYAALFSVLCINIGLYVIHGWSWSFQSMSDALQLSWGVVVFGIAHMTFTKRRKEDA